MSRPILLICFLSIPVLGCDASADSDVPSSPPPPPPLVRDASPIQSDSLIYTLKPLAGGYAAYGSFTYTNTTGHPIYFARCFSNSTIPLATIRRSEVDTTAPTAVTVIWACVGGVPAGVLAPGATVEVPVFLGSSKGNPPISAEMHVGRFRVSFELCSGPGIDECPLMPQSERQSNAFEVRFSN